jgi:diguanylate cyclase (GGDEF)-like protein/PAS domain S-box-containing protein
VSKILLVEDDAEHAAIVAARLREDGYEVEQAQSGSEAVDRLEGSDTIAAVVADYKLPAMNGLDLLAEVRRRGFDQPFIMLTAFGGEQVAVGALRGGASDYLVKDLDLRYLDLLGPTLERAIEKLRFLQESRKLASALENTLAAVAITDPQGVVEYVNPAFEQITGYRRSEVLRRPLVLKGVAAALSEMPAEMRALLSAGGHWQGEIENRRLDGEPFFVDLAVSPILDRQGQVANIIWTQHNITERKRLEQRVKEANRELAALAIKDALTGVYNRRYLETSLHNEVCRARRYRLAFSLLMMDVDRFKELNDRFGHAFGDFVLKTVAWLIRQASREPDILTRYGGEEFCLLLPNTDREGSRYFGERIRTVVANHLFQADGQSAQVTISLGAATLGDPEVEDAHDLLERADRALYRAKGRGRNTLCLWAE